jgi:hypothetical protein
MHEYPCVHELFKFCRTQFIEEQLKQKKGQKGNNNVGTNATVLNRDDQILFSPPSHLRTIARDSSSMENSTGSISGIVEVQLPMEYRLKNIEETEKARQLLFVKQTIQQLEQQMAITTSPEAINTVTSSDTAQSLIPNNFNANYSRCMCFADICTFSHFLVATTATVLRDDIPNQFTKQPELARPNDINTGSLSTPGILNEINRTHKDLQENQDSQPPSNSQSLLGDGKLWMPNVERATDDVVYEQFKKRFKYSN